MRPINKVRKVKERLVFVLSGIAELESFQFSKYIPKDAKKVEITSKEDKRNNNQRVLEIDYIISLDITKIEMEGK